MTEPTAPDLHDNNANKCDGTSARLNAQRWIDNSHARLVTETGRRLADELFGQGSLGWLRTALGETKS